MARGQTEQQMENAAHTYFERVTNGDVDGILELFADDAKLINPVTGARPGFRAKRPCVYFTKN